MAGIVTLRVEDLNPLVRNLIALGVDVEDLRDAFAKIAEEGKRIGSREAPVGSGRDPHPGLLKSDVRGNRARNKAVVTVGRVGVPYAGAINFGWRAHNIAPTNFMQAIDTELGPVAPQMLQQSINTLIRKRNLG